MVMQNHQAGGKSNIKILLAQIFSSITASGDKYTHMTHYTFLKASPRIERLERRALGFIAAWGLVCLLVLITA
jgi:hypothetical protein